MRTTYRSLLGTAGELFGAGKTRDTPGVIAPPPLIFLAILLVGLLAHWAVPTHFLPGTWQIVPGLAVVAVGLVLGGWTARTLRRAGTTTTGREPTRTLVVAGPYRFSRNPMYLSGTVSYLGITLVFNALWALVLLPVWVAVIQWGVITREERYLATKFGEDYLRYRARVRRWV